MQTIKEAVELHQQNLQTSLPTITKVESNELSLYKEGQVSSKVFADCVIKIKQAFPELDRGFFIILKEMLLEEKFSDQKLIDATKNLIKTFQYSKPRIANLLDYDKKVKTYTWQELGDISQDYSPEQRKLFWKHYAVVKIGNQDRYVLKEYEKYFT